MADGNATARVIEHGTMARRTIKIPCPDCNKNTYLEVVDTAPSKGIINCYYCGAKLEYTEEV